MAKKPTYEELEHRVKELEKSLHEYKGIESSLHLHEEITSNMKEGINLVRSSDGIIVYANPQWEKMFGYDEGELIGKHISIVNAPNGTSPEETANQIMESLKKDGVWRGELKNIKKDGTVFWSSVTVSTYKHSEYGTVWLGLQSDITERKRVEETLRKSENKLKQKQEQLRAIINNSTTVIYLKDIDGQYLLINKQYEKLFNIKENKIIGKTDYDVFPKEAADRLRKNDLKIIKTKVPEEFEEVVPHDEGLHTYISIKFPIFDSSGEVYGVCGISTDITVRKKMEKEISKVQKLESIGVLAGGIAHDFNNYLGVILNDLIYIDRLPGQDEKISSRVKDARSILAKAKEITQQLLTFSKGGEPIREIASISVLLKEGVEFFLRGSNVKPNLTIMKELWNAEVDSIKIGQALSNIIINAAHAMPDGGTLDVNATNVIIDEGSLIPLQQGKYLKISIKDYGCGIADDDLQKVFDPYFTTKKDGAGLGLTTSYSIVKRHCGYIDVSSNIGKGTAFTIYLPAIDKELVVKEEKSDIVHKKDTKVLLMDDEEKLLKVVSMILQDCGRKVVGAKDGNEALALFESAMNSKEPFDVVVLDLTIPGGMGGKETMARLLELDSRVKAIVVSGYSNDNVLSNYKDYGFVGMLPKPYDVESLEEKIREVLL